jgi:hypothetical protein
MAEQGTGVWQTISYVLFKAWKWIIHLLTGKPEIYRLYMRYPDNNKRSVLLRTMSILGSIRLSKFKPLRDVASNHSLDASRAVTVVMELKTPKAITPHLLQSYERCLLASCSRIVALSKLKHQVCQLRNEAYSVENARHEQHLQELWQGMMPGTQLKERISKQWQDLGFQGNNPATDFRGMGILGLKCMLYFCKLKLDASRRQLGHSNHPTLGYPYAITSINMTSTVFQLTESNLLDQQYLSMGNDDDDVKTDTSDATQEQYCAMPEYHFYEVFMSVFIEFDQFWRDSKPENIMEFSKVKEKFVNKIHEDIRRNGTLSFVNEVPNTLSKDRRP